MSKSEPLPAQPAPALRAIPWQWMSLALLGHTLWGAYPVLARYLQTVSALPSMAMLGLGNLLATLVFLPFVIRRIDGRFLREPAIWGFAVVVVLRAITNVLAARFTLAVYVQLITLMTPLIVALLSAALFREPLPPATLPAIGLSFVGSLLLISDEIGAGGLTFALRPTDWLGIAIAFVSALCLALYMILVPRTVKKAVPGEAVMLVQLIALTSTTTIISLIIGEDWGRYAAIGAFDWFVFGLFVVGVLLGANLTQIFSLRHLGAPLVSSTMAWRLISTLTMAALLLGEQLRSLWQALGAVIVLATITWYLWRQR